MSTIRLLTASTGKAGEKTLQTEDLATVLPNIKSGWLDILNPGEAEKFWSDMQKKVNDQLKKKEI